MAWVDSLDVSISEAFERFPKNVTVASLKIKDETYLVSLQSLERMKQMQLGDIPVSAITLPYNTGDVLTRCHKECIVKDFSGHLGDYFPNFFVAAIYELKSLFVAQNVEAYIIGGLTRDMLLSREKCFEINDVDITIADNALKAARYVSTVSSNFDLVQEFIPFGTAKIDYKRQIKIDFASTRQEIYRGCGMLPEIVKLGVPLVEDIVRRDFTINALALSILEPGKIIDCSGGLQDLETKSIRVLKTDSFFEDPSRILRMYHYATRLDFKPSSDTEMLLNQFAMHMKDVYKGGGDRIRAELYKFLVFPESKLKAKWMENLIEKGFHTLIDTTLPSKIQLPFPVNSLSEKIELLQNSLSSFWSYNIKWQIYITLLMLGLPEKYVSQAMCRIELNRYEMEIVEKSQKLLRENIIHPLTPFDSEDKLYDIFHSLPFSTACIGVILSSHFETCLAALLKYKNELENVKLEVSGDDILKLGIPQGEQVGRLLKSLLHAKLQGKVTHRLDEINWLKNQISALVKEDFREL